MMIRFKNKADFEAIDRLIEKYYEGMTTVDEEKRLHAFLSRTDLPEKYAPEQAMFGYFNSRKPKKYVRLPQYIRWATGAAAVVAMVVSVQIFSNETPANYAYVNGQKITDINRIKTEAIASLHGVSSGEQYVEEGISSLNNSQMIEEQLDVFSAFE